MKRSLCGTRRKQAFALHTSFVLRRDLSAAPIKRTAVERQVNVHIVFLFIFLLALSIGSTVGSSIRSVGIFTRRIYLALTLLQWFFSSSQWYLLEQSSVSGRGEQLASNKVASR